MSGSAPIIQGLAADGTAFPVEKMEAHRHAVRHRAISAFVFAGDRVLLQRRAVDKYHSGGQWANSCCSHPGWGETPAACVRRRVREELGVDLAFTEIGRFDYVASVGGGLVENEAVHLFAAHVDAATLRLAPDPAEVMATAWVPLREIAADAEARPQLYTPWLRIYLDRAWPLLVAAA